MAAADASLNVLRLARGALLLSAVVLIAAAGLAWAAAERRDQATRIAADRVMLLEQARSELAAVQVARARLEANLRRYETLRASGFVGTPDRVGLLEALDQAARALAAVPLRWELAADLTLQSFQDPKSGNPLAQARVVPMRLAADHVHEAEWMDLLARLRQSDKGQLRIEGCDLRLHTFIAGARELPSVSADCALAWVHIAPASSAASSPTAR